MENLSQGLNSLREGNYCNLMVDGSPVWLLCFLLLVPLRQKYCSLGQERREFQSDQDLAKKEPLATPPPK